LAYKENNPEGKKYYAWLFYKLHRELGIPLLPLPEDGRLFKQGSDAIKHAEVLKSMMKSGYTPDKPIKSKKVK
jgi:hypothetical protein